MSYAFRLDYTKLLTKSKRRSRSLVLLLLLPPALLFHSSSPSRFRNRHVIAMSATTNLLSPIRKMLCDNWRCSGAEPVLWRISTVPISASLNPQNYKNARVEDQTHLLACITCFPLIFSIAASQACLRISTWSGSVHESHKYDPRRIRTVKSAARHHWEPDLRAARERVLRGSFWETLLASSACGAGVVDEEGIFSSELSDDGEGIWVIGGCG